jgi:hypothetical protein
MPGAAIDLPGARQPGPHVTVPVSIPELLALAGQRLEAHLASQP